jgi:hypothetical protein
MPVGPSASRSAIQSDALSLGLETSIISQFAVIRRSTGIGSYTSESYYRSYKAATSCLNRGASWICHILLSRKKLQENLLHMISTAFSSLTTHNTGYCDIIVAPRQPEMAHAIGCRSHELSPKNLVFGTVLRAVFSASAMGFCVIYGMRLSQELRAFSSQLQLGFSPAV